MSTLLVAAVVGLLTPPEIDQRDLAELVGQGYPSWALRSDKSAGAVVSIWVDRDGSLVSCEVQAVVGDKRLGNQMCDLVRKADFSPAIDHSGEPTSGLIIEYVKMMLSGTKQGDAVLRSRRSPDRSYTLSRLPSDISSSYEAEVVVEVDEAGNVTSCNATERQSSTLYQLACDTVKSENMAIGVDREGLATGYVTKLQIEFSELGGA